MLGDEQIEKIGKLYFAEEDDKEKIASRKTLMEMAKAYRELIDSENKLVYNRTYYCLVLNGFLFAAIVAILTRYNEIKVAGAEYVLIPVALCISIVGIMSVLKYRREMNKCRRATYYLRARWKRFLEKFYNYVDYKLMKQGGHEKGEIFLTRNFILPPIDGLSAREEFEAKKLFSEARICKDDDTRWVDEYKYEPSVRWLDKLIDKLAECERWLQLDYVLLFLWIALLVVAVRLWTLGSLNNPDTDNPGKNATKQQVEISIPNGLNLHINTNAEVIQYPKSEQETLSVGTD